jgi:site-specific recombinase XerD
MTIVDATVAVEQPAAAPGAGMLALPASAAEHAELLAILEELADHTRAYVAATRAKSTRRAYAADWRDFSAWCAAHHVQELPAAAETVALYITQLASQRRVATVQRRLAAISQAHKDAGHTTPTEDWLVRKTMSGIRRTHGVAPRRKSPTRTNLLCELVRDLPSTPEGDRDRALLLVGFAGAFRRSELVALDRSDITFDPEGARITLRMSKTDQERAGAIVGLPFGEHSGTCPVRALRAWLAHLDDDHPPVFRRISRWGTPTRSRLTAQSVALVVKRRAAVVGQDPRVFAGHSLRAGLATSAAAGGATERDIMQQTRHRSLEMVRRYIREGELFHKGNAARFTGM